MEINTKPPQPTSIHQTESIDRFAIAAMGTRFELVIGRIQGPLAASVRSIGEEALELIREWDRRLSIFDRGSLLSHLNAHASAGWVGVDHEMAQLLAACQTLWRQTGGLFDPSVGAVMRGRGLQQRAGVEGEAWGFGHVEIDQQGSRVRFLTHAIELDLGAIAKGFALDLVGEMLREAGVRSAIAHAGTSSVLGIGHAPDGADWTIAIGAADGPRIALPGAAMSVSAGRVEDAGRIAHVVDPRTGHVGGADGCACAIGASAMECEAWSTALLVLGERPTGMRPPLTSVVRDGGGDTWRVEGDEAWRVSNVQEGVMRL